MPLDVNASLDKPLKAVPLVHKESLMNAKTQVRPHTRVVKGSTKRSSFWGPKNLQTHAFFGLQTLLAAQELNAPERLQEVEALPSEQQI